MDWQYVHPTFSSLSPAAPRLTRLCIVMGYSMDGLPHVGTVPNAEPGQYIVAGFTGHGMPQVFLAAEGLARMVLGDVPFENTSLPRLFKARPERLHGHAGNRHLDALPRLQEPQAHL